MLDYITYKLTLFSATIQKPTREDLGLPDVAATDDTAKAIFNVIFGLTAAVAVLIIVILSLNLAKSEGNPEEISKAKKGIIYTIVGLVVVLMAEVVVNMLISKI